MAALQGGEAGEEAALALVEQVEEEAAGVAEIGSGRDRRGCGQVRDGGGGGAARQDLAAAAVGGGCAVEEAAVELLAGEALLAGEVAQGVAGADLQEGVKFGDEQAGRGRANERLGGGAHNGIRIHKVGRCPVSEAINH